MNKRINDAMVIANRVQRDLSRLMELAQDIEERTEVNALTSQEKADYGLLMQVLNYGHALNWRMKFALAVEHVEGVLIKQPNGRYAVDGNPFYELTSGRTIQYRDPETGVYYTSAVEHNGTDYYIVDYGRNEPIEYLQVCIKA